MSERPRMPLWRRPVPEPGVWTFSLLFFMETMARASSATVVPLQAYDVLGQSEQQVSFLYTVIGIVALVASFAIPGLIHLVARRWTYTIGVGCMLVAFAAFATFTFWGQVAGMFLRVFGVACLNITLSLYIMQYVAKHDYVRNDAARMAWSTAGWAIAPIIGVWLYTHLGVVATHAWGALWALLLLGTFWVLRLSDHGPLGPSRTPPASPLANIGRFIAQPRLRLAWLVAFGRSCFWSTFFIYTPILMLNGGADKTAGGIVVGLGNAFLITSLVWQRISAAKGARWSIVACFLGMAAGLVAAGLVGIGHPWVSATFLLAAALAATGLDAVGPVVFYRAVRARERAGMTAVYRTYLDASDLLPPLVYGVLLTWFDLPVIYLALMLLMLAIAWTCWRHIPARLR